MAANVFNRVLPIVGSAIVTNIVERIVNAVYRSISNNLSYFYKDYLSPAIAFCVFKPFKMLFEKLPGGRIFSRINKAVRGLFPFIYFEKAAGGSIAGKQVLEVGKATGKPVVKEMFEEVGKQFLGAKAIADAKIASKTSLVVEGMIFTGCVGYAAYQCHRGDIERDELKQVVATRTCAAGGSIGGAFVGTLIFPVVGTFFVGLVGGIAGDLIGSRVGRYFIPLPDQPI